MHYYNPLHTSHDNIAVQRCAEFGFNVLATYADLVNLIDNTPGEETVVAVSNTIYYLNDPVEPINSIIKPDSYVLSIAHVWDKDGTYQGMGHAGNQDHFVLTEYTICQ